MARFRLRCNRGDYTSTASTEAEANAKATNHELRNPDHYVTIIDFRFIYPVTRLLKRINIDFTKTIKRAPEGD